MESTDSVGPLTKPSERSSERCGTCQKRKVKCGQEMPICFNCQRLGLRCEKKAKYKLKDVTHKTRRSVASTTSEKGSIWDPYLTPRFQPHFPSENYTALENAAALGKPGTYFLDANPQNFSDIYMDNNDISEVASSVGTVVGVPPPSADAFMERFEDYGVTESVTSQSRASQSLWRAGPSRTVTPSEQTSPSLSTGASLAKHLAPHSIHNRASNVRLSLFNKALVRTRDLQYYNHYRSVVVYNMQVNSRLPTTTKPFCHDENETEDSFENAAPSFNPLYHAMMALSALSMARRERFDRVDALEHYQQAVIGLREYRGAESVNLIYTHYFLLLYEVAACEMNQTSLELSQLGQLSRLLEWFFTNIKKDPEFVLRDQKCTKCTAVIMKNIPTNALYCDVYNLLLHRQLRITLPDEIVVGFFNATYNEGKEAQFEAAYKHSRDLRELMAKLIVLGGWSYRVLRNMVQHVNELEPGRIPEIQDRLLDLDQRIKDGNDYCIMNSPPLPCDMYDDKYLKIPLQIQTLFDSTQYTTRAILIYAHTSVYPRQRASLSPDRETMVQKLAQEILILTRPRWGAARPIAASSLMPIFMCGTVVTKLEDQDEVLRVLHASGAEASGRSFTCAIEALGELYSEQERVRAVGGDERDVDWLPYLQGKGMLDFSLFGI